ncbi:trigger factor [Spiroplasma citri]|uniref:Trigger factor n=1 Tax=Spiroplasma citri TaxID=2133 RepID=Q14P10_SPICI|nr:trigger factor [Spiroplasma citri]APE74440.1 trigger factor [Spiroplasma citri]QIA66631.1 trigger factor [Spiroplasma citri]QIA68514.1 trigger factor [Spiroplasma citri]QIA70389.1 trigger factor [Spiroplasma citri]QIA72626.1 trigger factor [Spiroplasma citri]
MKFKAEKIQDKGIGKWYVIIDGTEWTDYIQKAEKKAAEQLEVPGFRKGKVPTDLVKKHLTEAKILDAAHHLVVNKAYKFAFDQKSDIEPFSSPVPSVQKISKTEYILQLEFDLKPEVKISKYTSFTDKQLKKTKIEVKKAEIEDNINQLRNRFVIFKPKITEITTGDTVIFDFEGFVDGKPFKGGKATDFTLEIGSGQFIPGFEDAMIGLKTGDKKEINVTFPADYHVEELKATPAIFKLNIKEVKTKELPELNDELAKDVNLKGIDTLAKLEVHVKNNIYEQLLKQEYDHFIGNLFRLIAKDSKIALPESIIRKEANQLKHEFEQKLQGQQLDMKTYKKRTGMSEEDIFNELFKDAKNRLENGVIVDAVVQNENITATEAEIVEQYEKLGKQFGIDGKTLKETKLVSDQQVKEQVIHDKVFAFLYQNNGE